MRIFISQPTRGKTYEQILEERKAIEIKITSDFGNNVEFINSLFSGESNPLRSLSRALSILADADAAIFIGEWYLYPGCSIEHQCCVNYGIPILKEYKEVNT